MVGNGTGENREIKIQGLRQDVPSFDGTDPANWIAKCQYCFELYQIPEENKTIQAVVNFKGEANAWYRGYHVTHDHPS